MRGQHCAIFSTRKSKTLNTINFKLTIQNTFSYMEAL